MRTGKLSRLRFHRSTGTTSRGGVVWILSALSPADISVWSEAEIVQGETVIVQPRSIVVLVDEIQRCGDATMTNTPELDRLSINTIRTLSIDAVQAANSGHPGTPMALAPLV